MNYPRLANAFFDILVGDSRSISPRALGPRSIQTAVVVAVKKRVNLATHRTLVQLPSRIQGGMHPASTFSIELSALVLVACVGSTRPARRLKAPLVLFADNTSNELCVYTCHASSRRNLWVACMCRACETCRRCRPYGHPLRPLRRRRRHGGRPSRGPEVGEHAPEGNHDKTSFLWRSVESKC